MEIQEIRAFKIGDSVHATFRDAQIYALIALLDSVIDPATTATAATHLIDNKDEVVAILTGAKPRRKRSDAGKPHAKPAKIPTRIKDMPVDGGKFPENAGVTIEPSSKYKGK